MLILDASVIVPMLFVTAAIIVAGVVVTFVPTMRVGHRNAAHQGRESRGGNDQMFHWAFH
jgi:hypothetical protein